MRQIGTDNSERQRLIEALATLINERGYPSTAVVDIVREAHASKRTFYRHFANKQACYLALLQSVTDSLISRIRAEIDEQADWQDQVRQAITAYINSLAARPAIALSWIRDLPALGVSARPAQRRNYAELADMIRQFGTNPGFQRAQVPPITNEKTVILLGGLRELAAQTVEDGVDIADIISPAAEIAISILQTDTK